METSALKIAKLDVDNYGTWSIDMKNLLAVKGWYAAIDEDDEEEVPALIDMQARALKKNKYEIAMGAQVVREIAF
jgi:hypothetical protein